MLRNATLSLCLGLALASQALAAATPAEHEVLRWNRIATETTASLGIDPVNESRILAIASIAVHDALNVIDRRYELYDRQVRVVVPADQDLAVATAAHSVLTHFFPQRFAPLTAELRQTLDRTPNGPAKTVAIEIGNVVADAILEARQDDGFDREIDEEPGDAPGEYRPTPPDFTPAFLPHWGSVTPFALEYGSQFRPSPPPTVGSEQAHREMEEVREIGDERSATRSDEQSEIAKFWYENSTLGWNRIARALVTEHGAGQHDAARLFALVNIAMADGFIAGFEAKYFYDYWRPVTAIRESVDAAWLPFLATPPVPDHPSTHSLLGAAAAEVLALVAGEDAVPFSMTSGAPFAGITREFSSFSEAALENAESRVLAGIHFRSAIETGYSQGKAIGAYVVANKLRPAVK